MNIRKIWDLLHKSLRRWSHDNSPLLAAGLSFSAIFSLTPLLVMMIVVAGLVLGEAEVKTRIVEQAESYMGVTAGAFVGKIVTNARESGVGKATLWSILFLVLGSSFIFRQLQAALDMIWRVPPAPPGRGIKRFLKNRLMAFAAVWGVGFFLALFFTSNAVLSSFQNFLNGYTHILGRIFFWRILNFGVSIGVLTLLVATIFKLLPNASLAWRDVALGAASTALLLATGVYVIGLYFRFSNLASIYGVAGSFIVINIWVFVSMQILLLGAQFTWVYATEMGRPPQHRPVDLKDLPDSKPL